MVRILRSALGVVAILALAVLVSACGGAGTITGPSSPSVVATITANGARGSVSVPAGTMVAVAWTSQGATDCTVQPTGWRGPTGEQHVAVAGVATYTATCMGNGGATATAQVTVQIAVPEQPKWATLGEMRFRPLPARVGASLGMEVSLTTRQPGIAFQIAFQIARPDGRKDSIEFEARTPETLGQGWYGRGGYYPDQPGTYTVTATIRQSLGLQSAPVETRTGQVSVAP